MLSTGFSLMLIDPLRYGFKLVQAKVCTVSFLLILFLIYITF